MKPVKLPPAQEAAYREWMVRIGHTPARGMAVDKNFTGTDYDYRGYFAKYGNTPLGGGRHLTDEFKLPNHETFSVESRYARGRDRAKAGHWDGDTYIPPTTNLRQIGRSAAGLQ